MSFLGSTIHFPFSASAVERTAIWYDTTRSRIVVAAGLFCESNSCNKITSIDSIVFGDDLDFDVGPRRTFHKMSGHDLWLIPSEETTTRAGELVLEHLWLQQIPIFGGVSRHSKIYGRKRNSHILLRKTTTTSTSSLRNYTTLQFPH